MDPRGQLRKTTDSGNHNGITDGTYWRLLRFSFSRFSFSSFSSFSFSSSFRSFSFISNHGSHIFNYAVVGGICLYYNISSDYSGVPPVCSTPPVRVGAGTRIPPRRCRRCRRRAMLHFGPLPLPLPLQSERVHIWRGLPTSGAPPSCCYW